MQLFLMLLIGNKCAGSEVGSNTVAKEEEEEKSGASGERGRGVERGVECALGTDGAFAALRLALALR